MDPTPEPEGLSRRARRAVTVIAGSLTAIVAVGLIYLYPVGGASSQTPSKPPPGPPILSSTYRAAYQFVTPTLGWALVARDFNQSRFWILRTTDGAKHWETQLAGLRGPSSIAFRIQFFDQRNGFAFAGREAIYRTADGGKHWTLVVLPAYDPGELTFSDPLHGWYLGWTPRQDAGPQLSHLESTVDGGRTWTELPGLLTARTGSMDMRGFQFRNPRDGWAGTIDTDGTRTVYSSNDGGLTWLPHPLPVSPSLNPPTPPGNLGTDVKLLPGRGVLAVTLEGAFTSFDGGDTWRVVVRAPAAPYNEVAFEDATHWWAMQQDGDVYKTSDAGQSWVRVAPHRLDGVRFDIGIIDSKHAWVRFWDRSAPASGLALTADGGVHWTYANVPAPR